MRLQNRSHFKGYNNGVVASDRYVARIGRILPSGLGGGPPAWLVARHQEIPLCRNFICRCSLPALRSENAVTPITDVLAFAKQDGQIRYFSGQMPVFSHAENDTTTFRMITSQFCVQGCAKQSDIIRAFGVTSISVKRSVKKYRDEGPKGFYAPRVTRGPAVLVDAVVAKAEERLAEGVSAAEVAADLQVKLNTLQKAIRAGRIRTPVKKKPH